MKLTYDYSQLEIIKMHLEDLKNGLNKETMDEELPYYIEKIDNQIYFINYHNEVIVYFKEPRIEFFKFIDSSYFYKVDNFHSITTKFYIKEDIYLYDDYCLPWVAKSYLERYIKKLEEFLKKIK